MNNIELAWSVLSTPRAAFAELQERPRFWFPLLLTLAATVAVLVWYYAIVDLPWLAEHLMSGNEQLQRMPEAQRERAMAAMTRPMLMGSSVIGAVVIITVVRFVEAGYYSLAGKITNLQYSYRQWLALSCWSSLPYLLGVLVMAGYLIAAPSKQIGNEELQLLSFNELFFHRSVGEPGFALLSNLTLLHPWSWFLTVLGVRLWSGRSVQFSSLFALVPIAVVYGVWALIAFRG